MLELKGKHNYATVFTDNIDSETIAQIINVLNQPFSSESKIRIMPDCHAGAECVIGTTMTIHDKIVPNLTGVDVGCGMLTTQIDAKVSDIDLEQLDKVIRNYIPSGFNVHQNMRPDRTSLNCMELRCYNKKDARINESLAYCSVGTLGSGNHFLELDKDNDNNVYLVVHTGSRHLGMEVANYYQNLAYKTLCSGDLPKQKADLIQKLKHENRQSEIEQAIKELTNSYRNTHPDVPKNLAYLTGDNFKDYIHDMELVQQHAHCNRKAIAEDICSHMGFKVLDQFETIHNYLDTTHMILRKGAVSAQKDEKLLIPMNMRDGSLICIGKDNPEWNYSAPHGAGRIMSRSQAKDRINMAEFKQAMSGIYTTSVNESTIDEAPMVYKPMQEIMDNIQDTVEIQKIIKPIYNFKAS